MDAVECWGCKCGVPVVDGYHEEPTDDDHVVYAYPCLIANPVPRTPAGDAAVKEGSRG